MGLRFKGKYLRIGGADQLVGVLKHGIDFCQTEFQATILCETLSQVILTHVSCAACGDLATY